MKNLQFSTANYGAEVTISNRFKEDDEVVVTIDSQFMNAGDLRETAKRLNKEAKRLEKLTAKAS